MLTKIKIEKSKCKIVESAEADKSYEIVSFCFAKTHAAIFNFEICILHLSEHHMQCDANDRFLILKWASFLDAFRIYPFPT